MSVDLTSLKKDLEGKSDFDLKNDIELTNKIFLYLLTEYRDEFIGNNGFFNIVNVRKNDVLFNKSFWINWDYTNLCLSSFGQSLFCEIVFNECYWSDELKELIDTYKMILKL